MARLPVPRSDEGNWGDILNDFLRQVHAEDGRLKSNVVTAVQLATGSVTAPSIQDSSIGESKLSTELRAKLDSLSSASDGREIELRATPNYIQWRYVGGAELDWVDLVELSQLQGPKGDKGDKGDPGEAGPQGIQGPPGAEGPAGTTAWSGITDKPATFSPAAHKTSHATGGSDPLTPADIGAATAAQGTKADAALLATLIDAKGDLIVGTAADTVARLAPGMDGHVLTADSAQATGVKWAAAGGGELPYPRTPSGKWRLPDSSFTTSSPPPDAGYSPLTLYRNQQWNALGTTITTAAGTMEVALYADDGTGYPGARLAQFAAATLATGNNLFAFEPPLYLPAGLYWTYVSLSDTAARLPVSIHTFGAGGVFWHGVPLGSSGTTYQGGYYPGSAGPPPAVAPSGMVTQRWLPLLSLRAA